MKLRIRSFGIALIMVGLISSCKKGSNNNGNTVVTPTISVLPAALPEGLKSIFFVDENNGYVGGVNGGIYKTTNGGLSWQAQTSTVNLPVYGIYFTGASQGFAIGGQNSCSGTGCVIPGGFILRTNNGGQTWTKVYTPSTKNELTTMFFTSATTGFFAGDNLIIKTTDGGQTWTEYPVNNLGGKMTQMKFYSASKGLIVCLFDKIVSTNDGGITWQVGSPQLNTGYYAAAIADGVTYVGGQSKVIKSADGGNSWTMLPAAPANSYSLYFADANRGIVFGVGNYSGGDFGYNYAATYVTADGGNSWSGSSNINNYGLVGALSFPNNSNGYGISGTRVIKISF